VSVRNSKLKADEINLNGVTLGYSSKIQELSEKLAEEEQPFKADEFIRGIYEALTSPIETSYQESIRTIGSQTVTEFFQHIKPLLFNKLQNTLLPKFIDGRLYNKAKTKVTPEPKPPYDAFLLRDPEVAASHG
jgi:hypothetical protein